jgi:hypothetical protein
MVYKKYFLTRPEYNLTFRGVLMPKRPVFEVQSVENRPFWDGYTNDGDALEDPEAAQQQENCRNRQGLVHEVF